jgi:hypothetical protein
MAPSRAIGLLFPRASPFPRFVSNPTIQSRSLNTASPIRTTAIICTKSHYLAFLTPSFRLSVTAQSNFPCRRSPREAPCEHAVRRSYSTNAAKAPDAASERPEAPDHLDEKEKAIFDKLNEALDPLALEVLLIPAPELFFLGRERRHKPRRLIDCG